MPLRSLKKSISFAMLAAIFCCTGLAQSGRTNLPSPPDPPIEVPEEIANAGKRKIRPCDPKGEENIYINARHFGKFLEELNDLGNCGYRMEITGRLGKQLMYGAARRDPSGAKYEYKMFAAQNEHRALAEATALGKDGFYFRRGIMFFGLNNDVERPDEDSVEAKLGAGNFPGNGSFYIFERKDGARTRQEHQLIDGSDKRTEVAAALQETLNERVAEGYRPVGIFYMGISDFYKVLLEKNPDIKPEGDYLMLRYSYNPSKVFTKAAGQGYRPVIVGAYFAVMHRKNSDPLGVGYYSADRFNAAIKKLPQLEGARYELKSIDVSALSEDFVEAKPFFTLPLPGGNNGEYEYSFVELSNFRERYHINKDRSASITDVPDKKFFDIFQAKFREGYRLRDMFTNKGEVTAIFEREVAR